MPPSPSEQTKEIGVFELRQLVAAPLLAVVDADFAAARHFVEYLRAYGFEPPDGAEREAAKGDGAPPDEDALVRRAPGDDDGDEAPPLKPPRWGRLRTVDFDYKQAGPDGGLRDARVTVPALSMVTLPLLQVRDADFRFGIRLLKGVTRPGATSFRVLEAHDEPPSASRIAWRAAIAEQPTRRAPSDGTSDVLRANIDVKVRMRQADMPAGISQLLALAGHNVTVQEHEKPKKHPSGND